MDPLTSTVAWLLESGNPSARYLALVNLLHRTPESLEAASARDDIPYVSPARAILDAQYPAGYWIKPDRGYSPMYKATIWQLIFLADLGTRPADRLVRGCEHVIRTAFRSDLGLFSAHRHSTGLYPCLNGNLLRALWSLGSQDHPVLHAFPDALATHVLETGFACPKNSTNPRERRTWQPCVWGCVKVLRGLAATHPGDRSPRIAQALQWSVEFLLARDLLQEQRPALAGAAARWLCFGFPPGEQSDLLEALLALAESQICAARQLADRQALRQAILAGQDGQGRWALQSALQNTWADFGPAGQPNKWITLRALQVLAWLDS
jgi:hypothetical protein